MDTISKEKRSKVMSAIHSRDTLPEICVRKMLWRAGYRFRVCDRRIVGHPDIVIPKCRALIEVRGCFWHRHGWEWDGRKLVETSHCPTATMPKSNCSFWREKFRRNVRRDAQHERDWAELGWNLIVVWECGLAKPGDRERTFRFILRNLAKWERKNVVR
ncbi:MAG: DNA mismatch endonuclease Vsr [Kiritimatiellae bacterium]|nr:DNA mismatch endonuclease Vsr [Kiritimatiellia bacterium]